MKLAKYLCLLLVLLGCLEPLVAQNLTTINQAVSPKQANRLTSQQPCSGLAMQIPPGQSLEGSYLIAEKDTFWLRQDAHNEANQIRSELVVFPQPITQNIQFYSPTISGNVSFIFLHVTPLALPIFITQSRVAASCDKPPVIPVSTWRAGLTPPKELPVATTVKHIIVHHAAGSNTATNYTEVVRNIYVYHTQSNGWNDIGYNFVIAQDGTIYEGRDGQGKMDGDNVLGAHFCSQNTGTMGICLLGDYMTAQPTSEALLALEKLIAWKMKKENLDPLGQGLHAGSGKNLMNISGHRDGTCATDCPGDNLYTKLSQIRQEVPQQCSVLAPLASESPTDEWSINIAPNPSVKQVHIQSSQILKGTFSLYNSKGQLLSITTLQESPTQITITTPLLISGVYLLHFDDGKQKQVKRVVVE